MKEWIHWGIKAVLLGLIFAYLGISTLFILGLLNYYETFQDAMVEQERIILEYKLR